MSLWNVTGALQSPYGILRNSYTPMLPTIKAVYCWESLAILTCQKLNFRSIVEKNRAPTIDSMVSCIRGRGYASFLVQLFSLQKSMQNQRPPSFLHTKTTASHHRDWDGQIAPPFNISCRCSHTSSTSGGTIQWKCALKGSISSSSITCSAASVQPILFGSSEKILWCSINIHSNFKANSGGHFFNSSSQPSFWSSSSSSFCLSLIVSFIRGFRSGSISSNFLMNSRKGVALGMAFAATTHPTGLPAGRCTGFLVRFRRTTDTLRLPSCNSV